MMEKIKKDALASKLDVIIFKAGLEDTKNELAKKIDKSRVEIIWWMVGSAIFQAIINIVIKHL